MTKPEKLDALIAKAFSVLEHDSSRDEKFHIWADAILRRGFARILGWTIAETRQEEG